MNKIPGLDMITGSPGHGLSVSIGAALDGMLADRDYRVFLIMGDDECRGRLVWEAFMAAAYHKLDNLAVVIDRNEPSADVATEKAMALGL